MRIKSLRAKHISTALFTLVNLVWNTPLVFADAPALQTTILDFSAMPVGPVDPILLPPGVTIAGYVHKCCNISGYAYAAPSETRNTLTSEGVIGINFAPSQILVQSVTVSSFVLPYWAAFVSFESLDSTGSHSWDYRHAYNLTSASSNIIDMTETAPPGFGMTGVNMSLSTILSLSGTLVQGDFAQITFKWIPVNNLDLSVSNPTLTQAGASNGSDGLLQVAPGAPVQVTVPISGSVYNSSESRSTTVMLQGNFQQPVQPQTVSLADIQSGAVKAVTFNVTFDPSLAGTTQTITATIDPGNVLKESNFSNNTASVQVDVQSQYKLSLSLSNSQVYPDNASQDGNTDTTVTAQLTMQGSGAPVPGKIIQFSSSAQELSGGHNHQGGRPTGTFDSASCTTDSNGVCSVIYTASEFGGIETILGLLTESPSVKESKDLTVMVPGLFEVAGGSIFYRLTGQTSSHSSNHFLSDGAVGVFSVVSDFYDEFSATLGLNDMSLTKGGLFDISGGWTKPHSLHRLGRSVDIDQCAKSTIEENLNDQGSCPNGWIKVPKDRLQDICETWGGHIIPEPTNHCEF